MNKISKFLLVACILLSAPHICFAPPPVAAADDIDIDDLRPDEHRCPLTLVTMKDPVVAKDGVSYEREDIEKWFRTDLNQRSPMTRQVLSHTRVIENINLRKLIKDHFEKQSLCEYSCPLTKKTMEDPVIAADGYSYERKAIEELFKTSRQSPVTGQRLQYLELIPNSNLRKLIQDWKKIMIPEIARGFEDIYSRFLNGIFTYMPPNGTEKVELRIRDLVNPLQEEFDLSGCGNLGRYLSISTGYRKAKDIRNENKIEIWLAPHFLLMRERGGTAAHLQNIIENLDPTVAEVAILWNWGRHPLSKYDHLTTDSLAKLGEGNLLEKLARVERVNKPLMEGVSGSVGSCILSFGN